MAQQSHSLASHNFVFATCAGAHLARKLRYGIMSFMTKLLEEAFQRLRQLPDGMQDNAARSLIRLLEEEPEAGDREAIAEGRREFERGDFVTLEHLRH
jgi:hypothetical protein